jgi:hypothetical protein
MSKHISDNSLSDFHYPEGISTSSDGIPPSIEEMSTKELFELMHRILTRLEVVDHEMQSALIQRMYDPNSEKDKVIKSSG